MSVHLLKEISKLKKSILKLGAMADGNVRRAVISVANQDVALAREAIAFDDEIDRAEIEIEEDCLKILALHQPVATDLRYVVACIKINADFEKIGDIAVKIAKCSLGIADLPEQRTAPVDFAEITRKSLAIFNKSITCLVEQDVSMAYQVLGDDDEVDAANLQIHDGLMRRMKADPGDADRLALLIRVSKQLERVADYSTNIAEEVIYMTQGNIVRHNKSHPMAQS